MAHRESAQICRERRIEAILESSAHWRSRTRYDGLFCCRKLALSNGEDPGGPNCLWLACELFLDFAISKSQRCRSGTGGGVSCVVAGD